MRESCGPHKPAARHRAAGLLAPAVQQVPERHRLPDRGRLFRHHLAGVSAGGDPPRQRVRPADELRRWRLGRTVHRRPVRRGVLHARCERAPRRRPCGDSGGERLRADGAQRPRLAQGESERLDDVLGEGPRELLEEPQQGDARLQRRHRRAPQRRVHRVGSPLRCGRPRQVDCHLDALRMGLGLQPVERGRHPHGGVRLQGAARQVCREARLRAQVLLHRLQSPRAFRRLREAGASGGRAQRRTH